MCSPRVVRLEANLNREPVGWRGPVDDTFIWGQGPMGMAFHPGPKLKYFRTHTGAPMVYTPVHVIIKEKGRYQWHCTQGGSYEEALW